MVRLIACWLLGHDALFKSQSPENIATICGRCGRSISWQLRYGWRLSRRGDYAYSVHKHQGHV